MANAAETIIGLTHRRRRIDMKELNTSKSQDFRSVAIMATAIGALFLAAAVLSLGVGLIRAARRMER